MRFMEESQDRLLDHAHVDEGPAQRAGAGGSGGGGGRGSGRSYSIDSDQRTSRLSLNLLRETRTHKKTHKVDKFTSKDTLVKKTALSR